MKVSQFSVPHKIVDVLENIMPVSYYLKNFVLKFNEYAAVRMLYNGSAQFSQNFSRCERELKSNRCNFYNVCGKFC